MSFAVNGIWMVREKLVSKKKSNSNRGTSRKRTRGNCCHPEAQADMSVAIPKTAQGRKVLCFVRPGTTPTLEDAIARLNAHPELPPVRRRDLVSSLRRLAAVVGSPASQVPADLQWLHQRLAATPAAQLGRSPKTRANVLSNAVAALACSGVAARRPAVARSPEWDRLWQALSASARIALGSFARFCSFHGIAPEDVTDEAVRRYRDAIIQSSLRKKPDEAIRELTVCWNKARDLVPGWPARRLTVQRRRMIISPSVDALPPSFRADVDNYIARLRNPDVLSDDAPRPLAEATLQSRRLQIRRFFGELVASGLRPQDLIDLRSMVRPELVYRGLKAMLARKGEPSGMIHSMAYTLLGIAKYHARLPNDELRELRRACSRLKPKRTGMTTKNRARLRQFEDPELLNRLLLLPEKLVREAKTKKLPITRAASLVEAALAVELLLMTLLRIKNLSNLHLDDNLQWGRSSQRGVCHLVVDGRDVKNGEDRDFELEGATCTLLKLFIEQYRPILVPVSCRWLFARRDGDGPVNPMVLATRIKRTIRKHTGLTVNAHLFRALGAKIYLDQNPGGYEVVRRALGHKHLSTTTTAYTGMESISAAKQFDRTIHKRKEQARARGRNASSGF